MWSQITSQRELYSFLLSTAVNEDKREHGRLRSSDGQDMDEMRIGYGQTAVCTRPERKIDVKQGWNTSLMMRMMDGKLKVLWLDKGDCPCQSEKENKMCKATRYDRSNRYRTRGQLCRFHHMGVHIKQVDEVKGDARKKNRSIVVLELSKLLFSDALLVSLYSIDWFEDQRRWLRVGQSARFDAMVINESHLLERR